MTPSPADYKAWRQRALDYLSRDRDGYPHPDIRALLVWCEGQEGDIDTVQAERGAAAVQLREPVGPVSAVHYPAIRDIVTDAVLQRSERCQNASGLDLWRRLFSEMRGAAPQIAMVQAGQLQFPQRAPSPSAPWGYLERRPALGMGMEGWV